MTDSTFSRLHSSVSQRAMATRAFSLVEVVMSVAIVAFSLIVIVGMIPVGLKTMSDTQTDQAIGTIQNQLRGDLQQVSFVIGNAGSLSTLPSTTYYYTNEGLKTDSSSTDGPPYYVANFAVNNAGLNGNAFTNSAGIPVYAAAVTVTLTYPYVAGASHLAQTNVFSLLAAKQVGQ
jgi:uncharacterized protein (TIGR02598 family)